MILLLYIVSLYFYVLLLLTPAARFPPSPPSSVHNFLMLFYYVVYNLFAFSHFLVLIYSVFFYNVLCCRSQVCGYDGLRLLVSFCCFVL